VGIPIANLEIKIVLTILRRAGIPRAFFARGSIRPW
jgi:hypothetical protein